MSYEAAYPLVVLLLVRMVAANGDFQVPREPKILDDVHYLYVGIVVKSRSFNVSFQIPSSLVCTVILPGFVRRCVDGEAASWNNGINT